MGVWPGEGGCRARDRRVRVRARGLRERIILLHRGKTVAELYKLSAWGLGAKLPRKPGVLPFQAPVSWPLGTLASGYEDLPEGRTPGRPTRPAPGYEGTTPSSPNKTLCKNRADLTKTKVR